MPATDPPPRPTEPLDAHDPRFSLPLPREQDDVARQRELVESRGPGASQGSPRVRVLRIAVPVLAALGAAVIAMVFFTGLSPGSSRVVVGPEEEVRAALVDRPRRVCFNDANPCAWLTLVDGEIRAFNTNGPLPQEFGRQGVGWCPTSGYFGANSTGSRWDQEGRIVSGPAPRSLDMFTLSVDRAGDLVIQFASLTAGLADFQVAGDVSPPAGEPCEQIPFDRDPDLRLDDD